MSHYDIMIIGRVGREGTPVHQLAASSKKIYYLSAAID